MDGWNTSFPFLGPSTFSVAFAISLREGVYIDTHTYFYLEPFDDPCFDEKKRLLEGSTTKWLSSSLAVFLFKVKRVKRFEFRFDSAAFECLDGFSQGIISLNRWDSLGQLR